jgi:hypothetical protein
MGSALFETLVKSFGQKGRYFKLRPSLWIKTKAWSFFISAKNRKE